MVSHYSIVEKNNELEINAVRSTWQKVMLILGILGIALIILILPDTAGSQTIKLLLGLVIISSIMAYGMSGTIQISPKEVKIRSVYAWVIKSDKSFSLEGAKEIKVQLKKSFSTGPIGWYMPGTLTINTPKEEVTILYWKARRRGRGPSPEQWLADAREIGKRLSDYLHIPLNEEVNI